MRDRRLIGSSALLVSLMIASISPLTVSAAGPDRFGAKLDNETQPTPREWCRESNHSSTCTWVAVEAYANGGKEKAPRDGNIRKVRIISCIAGSFKVQVARAKPGDEEARIVRSGPTINYAKDTQSGGCGGDNFDNYKIQTFNVDFPVKRNDYIAVRGTKIGFIKNSSSGDALKFRPSLPVGGSYEEADDSTGSMLIEFVYGS